MINDETFMCEVHVSRQRLVLPSRRRGPGFGRKIFAAYVSGRKRQWGGLWAIWSPLHAKVDMAAKGKPVGASETGQSELNQKKRQNVRKQLRKRDGDDCFYCGLEMPTSDMTIEHVLAKKHGGNDKLANLALAHEECNTKAGDLPIVSKIISREVQHLL